MRKNISIVLFCAYCLINLTACGIFRNREKITVMRELVKTNKEMAKEVKEQESNFDKLRADFIANKISDSVTKEWILMNYGEPVIVKTNDDPYKQIFIYRYPLKYNNTEKIYLEFSEQGMLIGKDIILTENSPKTK